jgi:Tol biopolymer transport system component
MFVVNREYGSVVYTIGADGQGLFEVLRTPLKLTFPALSPDGNRLAFTLEQDGNRDIYILDLLSKESLDLVVGPADESMPAWSPDGTQLVFASDQDGDRDLYLINADGSNLRQLTNTPRTDSTPAWSPDGNWIAYAVSGQGDPDIFLTRTDGSEVRQMTQLQTYDGDIVTWSPDGRWLLFPSYRLNSFDLFGLEVAGDGFGIFEKTERNEFAGRISPDGKYLMAEIFNGQGSEIWVRPLDGSLPWMVAVQPQLTPRFAIWVPKDTDPEITDPVTLIFDTELVDQYCVFESDGAYAYNANQPMPAGEEAYFGSYLGVNLLSGPNGQKLYFRLGDETTNTAGQPVNAYQYYVDGGRRGWIYLATNDPVPGPIPFGFGCTLMWP